MEYKEAEKIVKYYNEIDTDIKLHMKWVKDIDDRYYVGIGAQVIDGLPHALNKISNPTELIALSVPNDVKFQQEYHQQRIRDLCACRAAILDEIDKLSAIEKAVITKFYHEGLKWEQVKLQVHYSIKQCKNIRRHGIYVLANRFESNAAIKKIFSKK